MATAPAKANDEVQIRARLDDWAKALGAKDIDGIMANFAPDILSFDCHTHLQLKGAQAHREFLEACFPHMRGPLIFEFHELEITAQDELAFCHYIARCLATGLDGTEHASWLRATVCLRKTRGEWLIAHGHLSAPFDAESGRALLGLEPERATRTSAA